MRKITLLMVAFVLSALGLTTNAETITQDFSSFTMEGNYPIQTLACPDGWTYTGGMMTVDIPASGGIRFTGYSSGVGYLVTAAKAGSVSISIAAPDPVIQSGASFKVCKMTANGSSYTAGEELVSYTKDQLPADFLTGSVVTFNLDEDCYIGITGAYVNVTKYENTTGGGGGGATVTVEENFNSPADSKSGDYALYASSLPNGWYLAGAIASNAYRVSWRTSGGVDGSRCLRFSNMMYNNGPASEMSYIITKANAGTVTIYAKATSSTYVSDSRAYFGLYKMIDNGDGTFTPGDAIKTFATLGAAGINATEFSPVTFDIEEDCFIGISANYCDIDNYSNTYTAAAITYTLSGKVTNEAGNAVVGATVSVPGCEAATTGQDGTYTIAAVPASEVTVTATAAGYKNYTATFEMTGDLTHDITLSQVESTLSLTCTNLSSGGSVTTATMSLFDGDTAIAENVTINAEGRYVFTIKGELNPDGYTLRATAPWFQAYESTVKASSASSHDIAFKYGEIATGLVYLTSQKVSFKATVLNEDQEYITNAIVKISYGTNNQTATNLHDGTYVVNVVNAAVAADNECTVTCEVADMKPIAPQTIVFNGEDKEVTFLAIAYQPTYVKGTVLKADSEDVVEGATVTLLNGTTSLGSATTDAAGKYNISFTGAVPETLTLFVQAPYYEDLESELTDIEREGVATANAELTPVMYTFSATVADKNNAAIEGAKVEIAGKALETAENGDFVAEIWAGDAADGATFSATASAPGYVPAVYAFSFTEEQTEIAYNFILEEQAYTFTANVISDYSSEPLDNATVEISSAAGEKMTVVNEGNGNYVFSCSGTDLPEGDFTVKVSCDLYETIESSFNFDEESNVFMQFALAEADRTLTVIVLDAADDKPLPGATVTVFPGTEDVPAEPTGTPGEFSCSMGAVFTNGIEIPVLVSAPGYDDQKFTFSFGDSESYEKTVKMSLVGGIDSILANGQGATNVAGKIYVNGEARIFSIDGKLIRVVRTQAAEEVTGLQPGIYLVQGQKMIVK